MNSLPSSHPLPCPPTADRRGGFTLVELISSTFVGVMLIAMFVTAFTQQRRVYRQEQLITEMQQNVRFAMETISRDIRMAGYGLNVPAHQLNTWVSWIPNFHQNPMISSGSGSDSDTMMIVAAFDAPVATLAMGAAAGNQTMTVNMLNGRAANETFSPSDLIFVGKSETLRIRSVVGDQITVSAHPTSNQGIRHTYTAGTPVELVGTIDYVIGSDPAWGDFPFLARIDSLSQYSLWRVGSGNFGKFGHQGLTVTAAYIEDMRFDRQAGGIEVSLRARTSQPDSLYVHPTFNDPYRRMNLTSLVRPRN